MFTPPKVKEKTKGAASTIRDFPYPHLRHRPSHDAFEQANILERSMGDQASPPLLSERTSSPTENCQLRGNHQHEADLENRTTRDETRGVAWDFSKIPICLPDQVRYQTRLPFSTPALPAIMKPNLVVGGINDPLEHEADRMAAATLGLPGVEPPVTGSDPVQGRIKPTAEAEI